MSQQELLTTLIRVLEDAAIEYMLTGSIVSSLQGEPRLTHDIDVVVELPAASARKISNAFSPPSFYLDEQQVLQAIEQRSMFNILHLDEGDKIDFWILTDDPFDQSRFSRRINEEVLGLQLKVSSPEDTILAKLRWAAISGGSEKQFQDAQRVFEVQHDHLDMKYLENWSKKLDVETLWARLKGERA